MFVTQVAAGRHLFALLRNHFGWSIASLTLIVTLVRIRGDRASQEFYGDLGLAIAAFIIIIIITTTSFGQADSLGAESHWSPLPETARYSWASLATEEHFVFTIATHVIPAGCVAQAVHSRKQALWANAFEEVLDSVRKAL